MQEDAQVALAVNNQPGILAAASVKTGGVFSTPADNLI